MVHSGCQTRAPQSLQPLSCSLSSAGHVSWPQDMGEDKASGRCASTAPPAWGDCGGTLVCPARSRGKRRRSGCWHAGLGHPPQHPSASPRCHQRSAGERCCCKRPGLWAEPRHPQGATAGRGHGSHPSGAPELHGHPGHHGACWWYLSLGAAPACAAGAGPSVCCDVGARGPRRPCSPSGAHGGGRGPHPLWKTLVSGPPAPSRAAISRNAARASPCPARREQGLGGRRPPLPSLWRAGTPPRLPRDAPAGALPSAPLFACRIWSLFPASPRALIPEAVAKPRAPSRELRGLIRCCRAPCRDSGAALFSCRAGCRPLRPSDGELAGGERLLR